jgi:PAS domain S-box-containing protein
MGVLVVDDEPGYPGLVARHLEKADSRLSVETAASVEEGLEAVESGTIECVIADYDFPGTDGIEFLRRVRDHDPDLPFVLVTGKGTESVASEAISAGVTDYFRKRQFPDQFPVLANRVAEAVSTYRAEQALSERRRELETYEHMLDAMLESAALYDEDERFRYLNENLAEWYGRPREELIGEASSLIPKVREERDGDPFAALWSGERAELSGRVEGEFPGQGRAVLEYNFSPLEIDGEIDGLVGVTRDVTERHRHEQELQRAFEEYQELFDGMNDTGWVLNMDGEIIAVNRAAVETLGYTEEELCSMTPADFDTKNDRAEIQAIIDRLPEEEIQVVETVHRTKAGEEIPVEINSSLITYGDEPAVLSIGRDISSRKERERRLEQFASVVSHDLRNPLSVAQGRLDLLEEECEGEHLEAIDTAHEQMAALIEDLLTLARGTESITPSDVALESVIEGAWAGVGTEAATLEVDVEGSIRADEDQLRRLFENLLRNAVEHASEDVTVHIGTMENGFFLADDGPGIPQADRDAVFEAGYSTAPDGTGMGLSIVAGIVEAHDWSIEVLESEAGGARFEVTDVEFVSPAE